MAKLNQPTATAFTRTQESWANHVLEIVREKIEDYENELREKGIPESAFPEYQALMDLYDDELFYERYAEEMADQRAYIRIKYLGG